MYIRRKVYSDVDYDFDGYDYVDEYDEEPRYYSVIMSEDELALFSDIQEYLYSEDNSKTAAAVLGGLGAATALGAGGYGAYKANKALAEEGGFKGVAKANYNARKAASAAAKRQATLDAASLVDLGKEEAKARAKELKAAREAALKDAKKGANSETKAAMKKAWNAIKGNKKLRYAGLGAAGLGIGAAGIAAGGKLKD